MTLGIMQPYFFPYVGYFSLIKKTDKFILLDKVQFIRHGWIERNRILKPVEGWQYIKIPLEKHKRDTLIKNLKICKNEDWRSRIMRQLEHYKKNAPFYKNTIDFLCSSFFSSDTDDITRFNQHLLTETCKYLNIKCEILVFSDLNIVLEEIKRPGDWALNISKSLNASIYVNPINGEKLFDKEAFKHFGIKLNFLKTNLSEYNQGRENFEPGLSIIDMLMFNDIKQVNELIDNCIIS